MSKNEKKNVTILAFPDERRATVTHYDNPDVLEMIHKVTSGAGSKNSTHIPGNCVNEFLGLLKEQNLSYSFKLGTTTVAKEEEIVIGD